MLVYGRQQYRQRLNAFAGNLRRRAAQTRPEDLDALRILLIQAGQLEQGVEDLEAAGARYPALSKLARAATDLAAAAFCSCWSQGEESGCGARGQAALRRFSEALDCLPRAENPQLTIRVPEGFEYYALFPEQYCVSAAEWAKDHAGVCPKKVAVVGLRSIGTTLSAVVAATLMRLGWEVCRLTVRPTGHPFNRSLNLGPGTLPRIGCAAIVDEGPGLSGSSMAAVARALAERGIQEISFFPGHAGEPGGEACPEVRGWWAKIPRYVTPLERLTWNGLSLPVSLGRDAGNWSSISISAKRPAQTAEGFADLSAGKWREKAFTRKEDWPAVCARFERLKWLWRGADGRPVVWKFSGLGCAWRDGLTSTESAQKWIHLRAEEGFVPPALGSRRGFVAQPWVAGRRLSRADANPAVLAHLGQYLARASGESMSASEADQALARITTMLDTNATEALGEAAAESIRRWAEGLPKEVSSRSYGDGRLAPHEWIQTAAAALLKSDCTGHELDHTIVGRQPLVWDVAGAWIEWGLEADTARPLMRAFQKSAGLEVRPKELAFYQMAYAAFRMGQTHFCAEQLAPGPEQRRLLRAAKFYRGKLQKILSA